MHEVVNTSSSQPPRRARPLLVGLAAAVVGCTALAQLACSDDARPAARAEKPAASGQQTAAKCGNGIVETGEECDDGASAGATTCGCQIDCKWAPSTKECRAATGVCDLPETCDGKGTCPTDAFKAAGTPCSDTNACNGVEACTAAGACVSPGPISCDDTNAATADTCIAAKGCMHLGFTGAAATVVQGNSSGGTLYPDACPAGQVMVGIAGSVGASFDQIQVVCGAVSLGSDLGVTIGPGATLTVRGANVNAPVTASCPANQMVVGFGGKAGALIDSLVLRCAPLVVSAGDGGLYTAAVGTVTPLTAAGGAGGNAFSDTDCAAGAVATGANIRAGNSIDAFGLLCSTPTVN